MRKLGAGVTQVTGFNESTVMRSGDNMGYTMLRKAFNRVFKNGREFQVAIYGAFNAMGLIGTENNGIVIGDTTRRLILADQLCKADSGWYGATPKQEQTFDWLQHCSWTEFCAFVNNSGRNRYALEVGKLVGD